MQPADLVALSLLHASRYKLALAVAFADGSDGRLETALDTLDLTPDPDPEILRRDAREVLDRAGPAGLGFLAFGQPAYPALLAAIPDPPVGLWVRGGIPAAPSVAIVGSRAASAAALEIARGLAFSLSRRGLCIVSGLARGCDGCAHQGALDAGGATVAVLGSGADVIYPAEHRALAAAIPSCGAVVSEFPPGTPPLPAYFPMRNRIISGLSRAVIVVEAGEKSGSLITAACALEQGREVMVVPGPVLSGRNRGAHALIRDGATLVESADDVVEALAGVLGALPGTDHAPRRTGQAAPSEPVLAALDEDEGRDLDAIVALTGLAPTDILVRLSELELTGDVRRQPGARFVRRLGKVIT